MHSYLLRVVARDVIAVVANNSSKDPQYKSILNILLLRTLGSNRGQARQAENICQISKLLLKLQNLQFYIVYLLDLDIIVGVRTVLAYIYIYIDYTYIHVYLVV